MPRIHREPCTNEGVTGRHLDVQSLKVLQTMTNIDHLRNVSTRLLIHAMSCSDTAADARSRSS